MTADTAKINKDYNLGNLLLSCSRSLTIDDLVEYSNKKNCLGKLWVRIKFFFTGKGIFTSNRVHLLITSSKECENILEQYPELKKLIKINEVALKTLAHQNVDAEPNEGNPEEVSEHQILPLDQVNSAQKNQANKIENAVQEIKDFDPALDRFELEQAWNDLENETNKLKFNYLTHREVTHRFPDVFCPRETAVNVLNLEGKQEFIHANHVKLEGSTKHFIASQAPITWENNRSEYRKFWKAVMNDCDAIFDLTNDSDRTPAKGVTEYGPLQKDQPLICEDITVTLKEDIQTIKRAGKNSKPTTAKLYTYEIKDNTAKTKTIKRIHYNNWPDQGVIAVEELDTLLKLFDFKDFKDNKFLIHCRAGIGRTGVLITAAYIKEEISSGKIHVNNFRKKIVEIILSLRTMRNNGFVQTKEQFILLNDYARFLLKIKSNPQKS